MRVSRRALGQTCGSGYTMTPSGACSCAGTITDGGACVSSSVSTPAAPPAPPLPVGYNPETGTISPSNVTGGTNPNLATTPAGLCAQEGGAWNGATCDYSALNTQYCTQFPFGGVYNLQTGQCSYMNFYLTIGGVALFAVLLITMSGRKR